MARRARPAPGLGPWRPLRVRGVRARARAVLATLAAVAASAFAVACGPTERGDAGPPEGPSPAAAPTATDRATPAPDLIVLVSIDTLRPDHLGLYGYDRFTSPVLDAFSRRGVVFEDASSTAPWTLPSHASMLTGLTPRTHRAVTFESALPRRIPTLARLLGDAGWRTAAVVNTHWLKPDTYGLTRDFGSFLYVESAPDRRAPSGWVTDQALEWIDEGGESPLFLFVHYYDVHADYTSKPEFERLFVGPYDGPATGRGWQLIQTNLEPEFLDLCHNRFDPDLCTFGNAERPRVIDSSVVPVAFDDEDVRHLVDLYDAGVRQMDTELARLLTRLAEPDLVDRSLVVVTSDHGEEFLEHGRLDHFLPTWQVVLRIPLVMVGPGLPAGVRVEAPVSNVDLAPTLLGLAGVPAPADLEGLDLAPLWRGGPTEAFEARYLHGEASGGHQYETLLPGAFPVFRSIRQGRYKLVYDSKRDTHALFDLETDPAERTDVSARNPEIVARLVAEMGARHADFSPDPDAADRVVLDAEDVEQLRALGYVP